MPALHFILFETALGHAALVWSEKGLRAVVFPRESKASLQSELKSKHSEAKFSTLAPDWIRKAIVFIQELVGGISGAKSEVADPRRIPLDLEAVPDFHRRVYREALKIKRGKTVSYRDLAIQVASPYAARAVGQAMAKNPFPLIVPCHRVLASSGRLTGFSAPGGLYAKQRLLMIEKGAVFK